MRRHELRLGQREILDELLKQPPANHRRSLFCASITKSASPSQANQGSGLSSNTVSSGASSSAQKCTPSGGYVPSPGTNTQGSLPGGNGPVQPVLGAPPTKHPFVNNPNGCNKGSWVIFGVNGLRTTLELDQIGDHHPASDSIFLRKLR
jgi:hypothetical protein